MSLTTDAQAVVRCPWGDDPAMIDYHDTEWGKVLRGDRELFERMSLEAFQSGLSWLIILRKREGFREAFAHFDPQVVATYGDAEVERLLQDAGIVRNRLKIEAAITNARATVGLRDHEGLESFVLSFAPADPPAWADTAEMATTSDDSARLSKELKKRGFAFVGPTTMFALMEAIGIFDPHLVGCHRRSDSPVT